jgi:RNA polymerase sigma factor (sigma-70 family)
MTANEFCNRVLPFKDKLFRLARRILINTEEAEDAVQEVFYKLWLKRQELPAIKSLEAFAMVVTKNLCLDRTRSMGYQTTELKDYAAPDEVNTPEMMTELKDEIKGVRMIVNRLPEQQRMIIHLRDIEGLEFEEIEQIMQINVNTIRVNLSRARKAIREQLIKMHNYEYKGDRNIT